MPEILEWQQDSLPCGQYVYVKKKDKVVSLMEQENLCIIFSGGFDFSPYILNFGC